MKKHTMQEWADFLGCYVAKDKNARVCSHVCKPKIVNNKEWGSLDITTYLGCIISRGLDYYYEHGFVPLDLEEHDWRVLVEPKEQKNDGDVNDGLTNWIKRMRAAQRQYERTNDENARREKERCESAVDVFLKDLKEVEE